ncbi:MAG TPA: DUF2341 domain-containing protein [Nannocystaceae bacterium]|nr:DUF2341 domain-containing protein [Nannocystaceae bacterium]
MRALLLAIACSSLSIACSAKATFACMGDGECRDGGVDGTCEADGWCSFPDASCPSGRRYGGHAPSELANTCVVDDVAGTSGSTTTASSTGGETSSTNASSTGSNDVSSSEVSSSSDGGPIPADWWDTAWSHRIAITVAYDEATAELVDVPVLIALTDERFDASVARPDGGDVRFVGADGTVLSHELDTWAANTRVVWLSLPTITNGDTVWLYYGNADAETTSTANVWGNAHVAVLHMGPTLTDASGALELGVRTSTAPGMFGDALAMNDTPIVLGDLAPLRDLFFTGATISAWIRPSGWGVGENWGRILDKMDLPSDGAGYSVMVEAAGRFRFVQGYVPGESGWETPGGLLALDQWSFVSMSYRAIDVATAPAMYVDGAPQSLTQNSLGEGEVLGDEGVSFALGGRAGLVEPRTFQGNIDELRIETTEHPASWHALQYASMTDALLQWSTTEVLP